MTPYLRQTTGLLVHFRFLVSSLPVEEGRRSCKCTNGNTDSIVQGRRLDKIEQRLMRNLTSQNCTFSSWLGVICSRVALAEDRSWLSAELPVVSLYLRGVAWRQFIPKRFPTNLHLIVLREAQRKGTSGDRGFPVRTYGGLATSASVLRQPRLLLLHHAAASLDSLGARSISAAT